MSHWASVKCDLKCSIDVMKRALLRINPEWERHMEVSNDGQLSIDNQYMRGIGSRDRQETARTGFNIKIKSARGGGASDLLYADMGLKRTADGSWEITVDPAGSNHIRNLQGYVQAQVEQMRSIVQASMNGWQVLDQGYDPQTGNTYVDVEIDTDDGMTA